MSGRKQSEAEKAFFAEMERFFKIKATMDRYREDLHTYEHEDIDEQIRRIDLFIKLGSYFVTRQISAAERFVAKEIEPILRIFDEKREEERRRKDEAMRAVARAAASASRSATHEAPEEEKDPLDIAEAEGYDICWDCGTISPNRCCFGAKCIHATPDGKGTCTDCEGHGTSYCNTDW